VAYAVDALDVVPNCPSKLGRVHILDAAHGAVGEIVGSPKFGIQKGSHIVVQPGVRGKIHSSEQFTYKH